MDVGISEEERSYKKRQGTQISPDSMYSHIGFTEIQSLLYTNYHI